MSDFSALITKWYRQNKRDLPWREDNDPYKIWLSEIILQQTRVEQGRSYYLKFTANYPTIFDLANASIDDILKNWQGLGYYSRAHNLHKAAKQVLSEFNGEFPTDYHQIMRLKGVGDYTASAIASISFDQAHAVVDGNVYRVLSRVFLVEEAINSTKGIKLFKELATSLLGKDSHGLHNQALMEIGALICKPKNPLCDDCPLNTICLAKGNAAIENLPFKEKKIKIRKRYFQFLVFQEGNHLLIEQRDMGEIWKNLYQFPLRESKDFIDESAFEHEFQVQISKVSRIYKHQLTHQQIFAKFIHFVGIPAEIKKVWKSIDLKDIENYPVPRLIENYLPELK